MSNKEILDNLNNDSRKYINDLYSFMTFFSSNNKCKYEGEELIVISSLLAALKNDSIISEYFNKNGEIIKLQIVKDGDVRLSDTSTKNNIVYITEDELLFTLERLANIPQTSVRNGSSAQYKYKRGKIPYSDEISQEFLKVYTEIKQQCDALKREQYAKNNLSSDNQYLNDLISREMQNVEISEWHQEDLENRFWSQPWRRFSVMDRSCSTACILSNGGGSFRRAGVTRCVAKRC